MKLTLTTAVAKKVAVPPGTKLFAVANHTGATVYWLPPGARAIGQADAVATVTTNGADTAGLPLLDGQERQWAADGIDIVGTWQFIQASGSSVDLDYTLAR